MRVFVGHDGLLRIRIGKERLESESLGPWYGGTGAIRLRQLHGSMFWVYQLDDMAYRGTRGLPESEFWRVRAHLPGAQILEARERQLMVTVPEAVAEDLRRQVRPLSTRHARLRGDIVAVFGDLQVHLLGGAAIVLFHMDGRRLNAFCLSPLSPLPDEAMMGIINAIPSARLHRQDASSILEVDEQDLHMLRAIAMEVP